MTASRFTPSSGNPFPAVGWLTDKTQNEKRTEGTEHAIYARGMRAMGVPMTMMNGTDVIDLWIDRTGTGTGQ